MHGADSQGESLCGGQKTRLIYAYKEFPHSLIYSHREEGRLYACPFPFVCFFKEKAAGKLSLHVRRRKVFRDFLLSARGTQR